MGKEFIKDKLDTAVRIRQIRENAGLTQEAFAEILGISLSGYKKIENAENQISLNGLRRLKRAARKRLSGSPSEWCLRSWPATTSLWP